MGKLGDKVKAIPKWGKKLAGGVVKFGKKHGAKIAVATAVGGALLSHGQSNLEKKKREDAAWQANKDRSVAEDRKRTAEISAKHRAEVSRGVRRPERKKTQGHDHVSHDFQLFSDGAKKGDIQSYRSTGSIRPKPKPEKYPRSKYPPPPSSRPPTKAQRDKKEREAVQRRLKSTRLAQENVAARKARKQHEAKAGKKGLKGKLYRGGIIR